ncbi:uncharacterized protein THITE_2110102 [Thermothielavioides terrestris NRRL 8126]|uniref:Uncharacterized protein n=1 Tax=Thermothielavioides terrestris (strain ATCC 38088 / NRRL 8126) TaxID=578455 RepID=G2QRR3_THETT|nr:uncharacterized protein THITE_2110102 [Thermothielavioides terrestris NRRL 8126]AEO64207.1 hypothetical protein THITE_2110102 [Thermothielavioides terrestris NRRL 8126]
MTSSIPCPFLKTAGYLAVRWGAKSRSTSYGRQRFGTIAASRHTGTVEPGLSYIKLTRRIIAEPELPPPHLPGDQRFVPIRSRASSVFHIVSGWFIKSYRNRDKHLMVAFVHKHKAHYALKAPLNYGGEDSRRTRHQHSHFMSLWALHLTPQQNFRTSQPHIGLPAPKQPELYPSNVIYYPH